MEILLSITFRDETSEFQANGQVIVIGRSQGADDVGIDLGNDTRVSRRHARITQENGRFWLEDLGSRHGTRLNGTEIKGAGKRLLEFPGEVLIGDTKVRLVPDPVQVSASARKSKIVEVPAAREPVVDSREPGGEPVERGLEVLSKLPLSLATETKLDLFCQAPVETVLELFPRVRGCALLLKDCDRDQLSLEAYAPKPEIPTVSEQLANRAISARNGFIWPDQSNEHMAQYHPAGSGMYSPLIWN